MWKLLIKVLTISIVFTPYGYANDDNFSKMLDAHIAYAQHTVAQTDSFEERKQALIRFEKIMLALDERFSNSNELSDSDFYSLVLITTTFKSAPITNLQPDNCDQALEKIHFGFDPTMETNPRLPWRVLQVYNLIALACSLDLLNSSREEYDF